MKQHSYGCIIIVGNEILIGQGQPRRKLGWDIFKGRAEHNETTLDTAKRELFEESNIQLDNNDNVRLIQDLGDRTYYSGKDLFLYAVYLKEKPTDLKCHSYFGVGEYKLPEIHDYKWVTLEDSKNYLYPSMYKVLDGLKNELIMGDR